MGTCRKGSSHCRMIFYILHSCERWMPTHDLGGGNRLSPHANCLGEQHLLLTCCMSSLLVEAWIAQGGCNG